MIENLTIHATGPDLAQQQIDAMQSPSVGQLLRHRLDQIANGHDQASDDARPYALMMQNFNRNHIQPMLDRTHGNATPAEITAAATAALKGAARLLAFADKAHRHALRLQAQIDATEKED